MEVGGVGRGGVTEFAASELLEDAPEKTSQSKQTVPGSHMARSGKAEHRSILPASNKASTGSGYGF